MPIIALTTPVQMPAGIMRTNLKAGLPLWQWCCGDDDQGGANDRSSFDRPQTVMGRNSEGIVLMSVEDRGQPLPLEAGAPPHQRHLFLSQPSTDNAELAKRIAVIVSASIVEQDPAAHCQIAPQGPWYSAAEMAAALTFCTTTLSAEGSIDEFLLTCGKAQPSAAPAGAAPPSALETRVILPGSPAALMRRADLELSFAQAVTQVMGADFAKQAGYAPPPFYTEEEPRADRLPTMILALEGSISFDWSQLDDIAQFDRGGGWKIEGRPDGSGRITGRGATILIDASQDPVPSYCIDNALARSFWFKGGRQAFARQSASLIITCDLDSRAAPFEDVRETAKVMTLVIGLLSRSAGVIALFNAGINTLLDPAAIESQVGHLHKNQIPLMMWTWTAPDSMVENSVSLSTGGLLPFLGYEVEVWNAPGTAEWVGDKMSHILNYLLQEGPVVTDGDTFGEQPGERAIRGFFGTTRANRANKVQALMLEFDMPGTSAPRPDPLPMRAPVKDSISPTAFGRRAGGFGRRGL